MITINYQAFGSKGFQLRLRLYQDGETRFINVTKLLKGSIQKKHWNQKNSCLSPVAHSVKKTMLSLCSSVRDTTRLRLNGLVAYME